MGSKNKHPRRRKSGRGNTKRPGPDWLQAVVYGFPLLAGLMLIGKSLSIISTGLSSRGWPVVQGQVIRSEIVETWIQRGRKADRRAHRLELHYSYVVNGRRFTGSEINAFGTTTFRYQHNAPDVQQRYPINSVVAVHYNPASPSTSFLETGIPFAAFATLTAGTALSATALIITWLRRKQWPFLRSLQPKKHQHP